MHRKRFLVLFVVLALSSLLLSGIAGSAVRSVNPRGSTGVPGGVVLRDGGGELGGDDDRWGDASPGIPTEEDPDPEEGGGSVGGDESGIMGQSFTTGELWSMQVRMFVSRVLMLHRIY
ncbi:hypothetical protein K8S17_00655 [bacterium]|nr:hypothetical protein [bacterium]